MSLLHDHGFVHRTVSVLQDHLAARESSGGLHAGPRHFAPHELAAIRHALQRGKEHDAHPGGDPYFARDPLISLVQSAMHEHAVNTLGADVVARGDERMGEAFTRDDIRGWGVDIALSLVGRLLDGTHPFEDQPAVAGLDDSGARLVLFGDWGTGISQAAGKVVAQARRYVDDAQGEVHVIHLGDTYYSGTPCEAQRHILDLWPVTTDQAHRVGSWTLNGNHDMYSGGHGYFETTLGDPRFARQRAGGRPTSWFHLKGRRTWDVVGLDTAYDNPIAAFHDERLFMFGRLGSLHGAQAGYVNDLSTAPDRRLLLLSHHQVFSAYDYDITRDNLLRHKLEPALARNHVHAWFWGHEHDCMAYESFRGVTAAWVIGHGAVPRLTRTHPPGSVVDAAHGLVRPAPPADTPADHPLRFVRWEYRGHTQGQDGKHWAKHGFAVVDIAAGALRVRHIDEDGDVYADETI
jgi:Calcineurin-like phosphoesterase